MFKLFFALYEELASTAKFAPSKEEQKKAADLKAIGQINLLGYAALSAEEHTQLYALLLKIKASVAGR